MATIKDIAKLSNVSTSTVSRVLNNDSSLSVTEETRKKVNEVAEKLQYTLPQRKSVKKQHELKDMKIGLIIYCSEKVEDEDPYFLSIRQGVEQELYHYGLEISKVIRWINYDSYESLNGLDSLIVIGKIDFDFLNPFFVQIQNIVFVDYSPNDEVFDSVIVDFEKATYKALDHLLENGHASIGFIGGTVFLHQFGSKAGSRQMDKRLKGFRKYMESKGLFNEDHVYIGDNFTTQTGYELMKKAISNNCLPTAFIIASDPMAIGAYRALEEAGISIPNEVSIVAFDDITIAQYMTPPLTTIKVYSNEMGKAAVRLLDEKLNGREVSMKLVVPTKLIIRQSTVNKFENNR